MRYIALLALLAITACSAPAAQATRTTTSSPTTSVNVADVAYLAAVRPTVQGSTDADLIQLGKQACTHLDSDTVLNVASWLVGQGFSTAAAAAITTAAIPAYCPQHKDMLTP